MLYQYLPCLLAIAAVLLLAAMDAATAANPIFPLKISANKRYLVDQQDAPFLWIGDTGWSAIADLTKEEIDLYLNNRKDKGFTVILVNLLEHKFSKNAPNNTFGQPPFTGSVKPGVPDFTTPNEAYFQMADYFLQKTAERGMLVLFDISYVGARGGDEGWFKEMLQNGPERLRQYGRFLGARYKEQANIIWVNGGDYDMPAADAWVVEEVQRGIKAAGAAQLMTVHSGGHSVMRLAVPWSRFDWIDLNFVYDYREAMPPLFRAEYQSTPTRPVFLMETAYENEHGAPPERIRRQAWWPYFTGMCGQIFGNNPIWHFDGPTLFPAPHSWRTALDAQGSQDMARLASCLRAYKWWTLVPDNDHALLTSGFRSGKTEITAARAADGSLAMVYIPSSGIYRTNFTLDMSKLAGAATAKWYNPTSGAYTAVAGSPFANSDSRTFTTPGDNGTGTNDWLLVLTVGE